MGVSWKVEVTTTGDGGRYVSNRLRFPDELQASTYGAGLFFRWTAVEKWRVVQSDDPVNYVNGEFVEPQDNVPNG